MILKFNKNIYDSELVPVSSGDRKAMNYQLAIDDNGDSVLVGEEYDLQEVIDSYADQCSIARILQLHGLGDLNALDKKPGVYLDETQVNMVSKAGDPAALNVELFKLYQGYKDLMTFEQFSNAILHGDFNAFAPKQTAEAPKETE